MPTMTKRERLNAAIHHQETDIIPYSFWSHLPGIDLDPVLLAEKTYEFYRTYDLDFIKTMNNGMYAIEDFGCICDYSEIKKGGIARITTTPIHCAEDWYSVTSKSCNEGSLARELLSLKLLLEKTKEEDVPVIFTVFSPITIADKLCMNQVLQYIEDGHSEAVKYALEAITETTVALAKAAIELGADGIFFASQLSTYDRTTPEIYAEYGKAYDIRVLEGAKDGWMNTLHVHGSNIMFDLLRDYPVDVFNWHAWETLPQIDEAQQLSGKCLMGGLDRRDITNCNRNEIRNQIFNTVKAVNGRGLILTPGCVVRYPLNDAMLAYIRSAKNMVEQPLIRR